MPTIPVNSDGAVLYYEDSGPPDGTEDYTTIIVFHGFIFHGASFRPLFPYASSHGLRIVTVNHREYPGSSPLNEREMADVWSPDPERQATALRSQALELAVFIARFIERADIPPPSQTEGKETGGIACMAWSQGCGPSLSLLASISHMDVHTSALLERYMRTVFLYDPPCMMLGVPFPQGVTTPIHDPHLPDAEKPQKFIDWISSYFNPLSNPQAITDEALQKRYNMYEATGEERYLPISLRIKKTELKSIVAPEIYPRIGIMLGYAREVYDEALQKALFDTKGRWPRLRTVALWPDMTIWTCSLSYRALTEMVASPSPAKNVRRKVEMVELPGANHVYHYDQPEKFVGLLANYI